MQAIILVYYKLYVHICALLAGCWTDVYNVVIVKVTLTMISCPERH